mmetsp:Transcript_10239/g.15782  ORF Transcript_10239/g.15782 Transcript_10239/m.15782 type:complete len:179 (-) Transcript_10239:275-811(-)
MQVATNDKRVDRKMKLPRDKTLEEELEEPPKKKQNSRNTSANPLGCPKSEQYIATAIVALGKEKSLISNIVSPLHMPLEMISKVENVMNSDDDDASVEIVPESDTFSLEKPNKKEPDVNERYVRSYGNEVSTAPGGQPLPPPPFLPRCRSGGVVLHDLRKDQGKMQAVSLPCHNKNWL